MFAVSLAAPASAGSGPGRLDGNYKVKLTFTKGTGTDMKKGDTAKQSWSFKAQCASGPCPTILSRKRVSDDQVVTYKVNPKGSRYVGTGTYVGNCFSNTDGHVIPNAYDYTESVDVKVSGQEFKGTFVIKFTPKAGVSTAECNAGELDNKVETL